MKKIFGVEVLGVKEQISGNARLIKSNSGEKIRIAEEFKNHPLVILTEKVVDLASSILKKF